MKNVLGLALYGPLAASTRYRMGQYVACLAQSGIRLEIRSLLGDDYLRRSFAGQRLSPWAMLLYGKRLAADAQERRLWTIIVLLALLCLPMVSLATTAVDRVALYLIPIQIFVFSRIPRLAGGNIRLRTLLVLGVIAYYAAVLFVWLNFATHAQYWLPYQFKPFV